MTRVMRAQLNRRMGLSLPAQNRAADSPRPTMALLEGL